MDYNILKIQIDKDFQENIGHFYDVWKIGKNKNHTELENNRGASNIFIIIRSEFK